MLIYLPVEQTCRNVNPSDEKRHIVSPFPNNGHSLFVAQRMSPLLARLQAGLCHLLVNMAVIILYVLQVRLILNIDYLVHTIF